MPEREPLIRLFTLRDVRDLGRPGAIVYIREARGRAGCHVEFDNAWRVSIQWGNGMYCDNRDAPIGEGEVEDSATAEIAVWSGDDGDLMRWPNGDTVQGWCSWDRVQRVLDLAAEDKLEKRFQASATPLSIADDEWVECDA